MNERRSSSASIAGHETLSKILSAPPMSSMRRGSMPVITSNRDMDMYALSKVNSPRNRTDTTPQPYHNPDGSRCVPGSPDFLNDAASPLANALPSLNVSSLFGSDWSPCSSQNAETPAATDYCAGPEKFPRKPVEFSKPVVRRHSDYSHNNAAATNLNRYASPSSNLGQYLPVTNGQFHGNGLSPNAQFAYSEMDSSTQLTKSSTLRECFSNNQPQNPDFSNGSFWTEKIPTYPTDFSMDHSWLDSTDPSQRQHNMPPLQSSSTIMTQHMPAIGLPKLSQMPTQTRPQRFADSIQRPSYAMYSYSEDWRFKPPSVWTTAECLGWARTVAQDHGLSEVNFHPFQSLNGAALVQMGPIDFAERDLMNGQIWYQALRKILERQPSYMVEPLVPKSEPMDMNREFDHNLPLLASVAMNQASNNEMEGYSDYLQDEFTSDEFDDIITLDNSAPFYAAGPTNMVSLRQSYGNTALASSHIKTDDTSDMDSCRSASSNNSSYTDAGNSVTHSYSMSPIAEWCHSSPEIISRRTTTKANKSERPKNSRSKHGTRGNHLWEFIRDLLKNPKYCPKIVKWENQEEGVFRFVESEAVAKMWGTKKCNPRMTYEKLSRAMRTYYNSQILLPVPKTGQYPKKLVYKFGPKANGWERE